VPVVPPTSLLPPVPVVPPLPPAELPPFDVPPLPVFGPDSLLVQPAIAPATRTALNDIRNDVRIVKAGPP